MSTSVPLGETALFMGVGEGEYSLWLIDGLDLFASETDERGVVFNEDRTNAPLVVKSYLKIPGTMKNDNMSVQCALALGYHAEWSQVAYLTVFGKLCTVNK